MKLLLHINGKDSEVEATAETSLLEALRSAGFFSAKRGCETGVCGNCAVLLDGELVNSCQVLAVQAAGGCIRTAEGLGTYAELGWQQSPGLHPLQQAFIDAGAIQCGYCTPAMLMAATALLERKGYGRTGPPEPISEAEARAALAGVVCRCTGYIKPVQAVLRAAAQLRGELEPPSVAGGVPVTLPEPPEPLGLEPEADLGPGTLTQTRPVLVVAPAGQSSRVVGRPQVKVDGAKLAQGKPAFAGDFEMRGMLIARVLHSPVAHARIKHIDVSRARALPGVACVLTYQDIPRVAYSTAGQSDPLPAPLDTFSLDNKVRFVGDRVAFVAAESEAIARQALELIDVVYEELPCVVDPRDAWKPGAPVLHDEADYVGFDQSDPQRNLAAHIRIDIGNVEQGFAEADYIFENEYVTPKVQPMSLEPHVVVTYWDDDGRLVIRTATQIPFHVRRILAPVLKLPLKRIRVVKPRIGGGFGGKQEVLVEDVAAHLTIATGRPVRFAYTRGEEFIAARVAAPDARAHENRRQGRRHGDGQPDGRAVRHRSQRLAGPDRDG